MFQTLDPNRIIETIEKLHSRISARFPEAGLAHVCEQLAATARDVRREASKLSRPNWPLRVAVTIVLVLGITAQIFAAQVLHIEEIETNIGLLQSLEAAVNLLILFGGAAWFMISLEERMKRRRALDALHQLRSIAHVVDMHQLTKDPTVVLDSHKTKASPERTMTRFELTRYLDYCAEMQALIGKLAALYADRMRDSVVIDAVNEIENLTTGLARKIWQKITLISDLDEANTQPR